jgi:hypothetical protein
MTSTLTSNGANLALIPAPSGHRLSLQVGGEPDERQRMRCCRRMSSFAWLWRASRSLVVFQMSSLCTMMGLNCLSHCHARFSLVCALLGVACPRAPAPAAACSGAHPSSLMLPHPYPSSLLRTSSLVWCGNKGPTRNQAAPCYRSSLSNFLSVYVYAYRPHTLPLHAAPGSTVSTFHSVYALLPSPSARRCEPREGW